MNPFEARCSLAAVFVLVLAIAHACPAAADNPPHVNHLAGQKSPYLLQHIHNPVDWYPWGPEAFARARRENKPIFLSVGYSTCHWCHVMEGESFENADVAKLLNDSFVAVKVDREERPDVDAAYMQFLLATSGRGGWPMNLFLTPDLKPFAGGTYFPADDRDGLPGMKTLLPKVRDAWAKDHDKIVLSADHLAEALKHAGETPAAAGGASLDAGALDQGYKTFASAFDTAHGGFGAAPKFPQPVVLTFLFHEYARTGQTAALDMALQTLREMAAGGIHDVIGGGFHRYSTDDHWFLPHFEKMLYDQALLAGACIDAYQITHDAFFADLARDVLDYVLRDMTGPEGQFYCAEDADSAETPGADRKFEGAFYVWAPAQLRAVLGTERAETFAFRYGVRDAGNVDADPRGELHGKNVLFQAHTIAETARQFRKSAADTVAALAESRRLLLEARAHRPRPLRDDKTLVAWNGLMISAMARAGRAFSEPRYTRAATHAAEFLQSNLLDPRSHTLMRRWRDGQAQGPGFLEDYAFFIRGLLDLYESSFDVRCLATAMELQHKQDELFQDAAQAGYFDTPAGDENLFIRSRNFEDDAVPSGNSVAAMNLLRLAQLGDDPALRQRADKTIDASSAKMRAAPASMALMLCALDARLQPARQIVIAGKIDADDTRAMLKEVFSRYLPNTTLMLADGAAGQAFLSSRLETIKGMHPIDGRATAYVCENFACQLPTTDLIKLASLLDSQRHAAPHAP